jgi:eukaryotic-like serine/threonine-protein kinase
MASPASVEEFLDLVQKSCVADEKRLDGYVQRLRAGGGMPHEASRLAGLMVRDGIITQFQAEHLMQGKWRRFTIGKYKVLEKLGSGGMGTVFLCEHKLMRCLRAIKILPAAKAQDEAALGRFYREARAVAAIDHPNIVHAYDIDQDENLHFLVMEYVDGASMQEIVKKTGPLSILRACHYIRQSAIGLDHAQRAGLVHRDIKPGNILVSREGAVKILDMGLARFFNDDDDILTRKFDENVLGTADYLAPEQALDSHTVDIRADIYSLGATFYFLLTGKTPFGEGTVAQKLFWHQSRNPRAVREARPDAPVGVEAIISKMMAKEPAQRYQTPAELVDALAPFTQTAIGAPPESEMPKLCPAAHGRVSCEANGVDSGEATAISKPETPKALKGMGTNSAAKQSSRPVSAPSSAPPIRPVPSASSGRQSGSSVKYSPPATTAPAPSNAVTSTEPTVRSAPVETEPEEEFTWQRLASDTENLVVAEADTTPNRDRTPPRGTMRPPAAKGEQKAVSREKSVVLLLVGLMIFAALFVVVVGGGLWLYSFFRPAEAAVDAEPPLIVSTQGPNKPGVYRSVAAALGVARQNAVIEIHDDIAENVRWAADARRATEVTIQAAPGKEVTWRSNSPDPRSPLLHLTSTQFLKIKGPGLTLSGDLAGKANEKVRDLIYVIGTSPGLVIEDVKFRDFGHSGVCVFSAAGTVEEPMRLKGLTALTPPALKDGSLVYINVSPDMKVKQVDYLDVSDLQGAGLAPEQLVHAENAALGPNVRLPGGAAGR